MPIVYLDRDLLKVFDDTYGVTITTVVTKPKSRGYVKLRSANPDDMPLVSPHLLKHPDDMATMIAGQRFFRDVLLTGPLGKRVEKVIAPAGPDLSDEVMAEHCRRFVKTNYHPASTARMGADGDRMAVLDARLRVRGIDNLRVADMSAVPNINAGNTAAPGDDAGRPLRRLHPRPRPAPRVAGRHHSREPPHDPRPLPPRRQDRPRHRRHPRHRPRHRHRPRRGRRPRHHVLARSRSPTWCRA